MPRYPVFIVGSPRSGTSILVDALLSTGYKGYREGMFLSMLHYIDQVIDRHYTLFGDGQNLIAAVSKNKLKHDLYATFRQMTEAHHPAPPWFDKTGNADMILAIPTLLQLWPDAAFIFAKRRAIENVISRLKKFPQHSFEYHCIDWSKNMSAWRQIRGKLAASSFVEVDQQDMIQQPEKVAETLRSFLSLSPDQGNAVAKTLRSNRPQQTEEGSAARVRSLASSGFGQGQLAVFHKHCDAEMGAYGYSMDENYRAVAALAE